MHLTTPFHQKLFNVLISPALRWDAVWYLRIAESGYMDPKRTVFFPLYPALVSLGGGGKVADPLLGILISCLAAVGALYLLHRLVTLERGLAAARSSVWIFAWVPVALFLSAVYSEALFLLLTLGSFYSGRLGRWWLAGLLGALSAATRNSGVLIAIPLLLLYFYGPRADRQPDAKANGWRRRYRPRADVLWIAMVPLGLFAYLLYLKLQTGHALSPYTAQHFWERHFIPLGGIPLGIWFGIKSVASLVPGSHVAGGDVLRHLVELAFLLLGLWLCREAIKRLPLAYWGYALVAFLFTVSAPATHEPLKSLPRFTLVIFPFWIALALWAREKRLVGVVIAVSAPLLMVWAFLFTAWRWAA